MLNKNKFRLVERNGFLLPVRQHLFVTDDSLSVVIAAFRETQIAFPVQNNYLWIEYRKPEKPYKSLCATWMDIVFLFIEIQETNVI